MHNNARKDEPKTQNFDSYASLSRNVLNAILVARAPSCRVANAIFARLKLIWPRSGLKATKISKKNAILAKSSRCQWVKGMSTENNAKKPARQDTNFNRYLTREMQVETTEILRGLWIRTLFVALVKSSK